MVESEQNIQAPPVMAQCITCGYDLRGLEIDSSCPECGTSIELSMRGNRLSLSDPAWVAKLARGQSLLVQGLKIFLLAICVGSVYLIIGIVVPLVVSFGSRFTIPSWFLTAIFTIIGMGIFFGIIIATIGCILVTTQDPRESLRESSLSTRNIARKALFAVYATVAIEFACSFVLDLFTASNTVVQVYIIIMFIILGIFLMASLVATLRWLMNLALRIPDHELRKRTLESSRFFYWALPVFFIINIIIPVSRTTPGGAGGGLSAQAIWFMLLSCASVIFMFAILIRSNRLYLILREYSSVFRKCAAEADAATTTQLAD
ncbi:MAG: hypothetical protein IH984_15375 [Planctomycetes bacterium]|nr:hypothetical protein [Planctomycetota bacterium]